MPDSFSKSKRLRKKLYQGEFRVFGFSFEYREKTSSVTGGDSYIDRIDKFWEDFIEARHLTGVTSSGLENDLLVSRGVCDGYDRYQSATEKDREALIEYLKFHLDVIDYAVSPLWDLYHGNDDDWIDNEYTILSTNHGLAQ